MQAAGSDVRSPEFVMSDPNIITQLASSTVIPSLAHVGIGVLNLSALLYFIRGAQRGAPSQSEVETPKTEDHEHQRLRLLERLVGAPRGDDVLWRLADYLEASFGKQQRMHCCVLLLAEHRRLRLAAAPSLPAEFGAILHGAEVDSVFGPTPPGAWDPHPLLVADMLSDTRFAAMRAAARTASLCSCWTVPIRDESGRALGVLAVYGRQQRQPDRQEILRLYEAGRLAAIELRRRHANQQLQARERELQALIDRSPDSIARYDRNGCLTSINAQGMREAALSRAELFGHKPSEFPGGPSASAFEAAIAEVVANGDPAEIEVDWTNAAGRHIHSHVRLEPECDDHGQPSGVLAVSRDLSSIVGYRQKLQQLAYVDALTGLPNRARLKELLDIAAHNAARQQGVATLMVLGLDRFKAINDSYGRSCGDTLLKATSQRLCLSLEPACAVARLEGDEFAILLPATDGDGGDYPRPRILDTLAAPFHVGDLEIRLTACLGIAEAPAQGVDAEELLRCATMALHHAKLQGRGRAFGYVPELTAAAQDRLATETDMRKALAAGEFELVYQPKVELAGGTVIGAEALLRWRHPKKGLLTPDFFVPLAEESGLIGELGGWALREACRAARAWNADARRHCPVAVNLSARQFADGRLEERVRRTLADTGCRPEWLELEITESLLLDDDPCTRETLESLAASGIPIAIDDFGTGYSALAYLTRFPIHTLKIDRSFVAGMLDDADSAELVRAIVAMARSLRMTVVAEGVERVEQADFLLGIDCQSAQGFLYGRAMDADAFAARLGATSTHTSNG